MNLSELMVCLDSADLTPIEKLQYAGSITRLFNEANKLKDDPSKGLERLKIQAQINEIAQKIGFIQAQSNVSDQAENQTIADVKKYFDENLNGKEIDTVKGKVKINKADSWKKLKHNLPIDNIKLKLVKKIEELLSQGDYLGEQKLHKERTDKFTSFHVFGKTFDVDDVVVQVEADVGQYANGKLLYNISHSEQLAWEKRKALASFVSGSYPNDASAIQGENDISLDSIETQTGEDVNLIVVSIKNKNGYILSEDDLYIDESGIVRVKDSVNIHVEKSTSEQSEPVKKTLTQRQKANNAAIALLKQIESGEVKEPLSNEQRETLQGYSGSGGGLTAANGETGSPHEYYTPRPVAQSMWDMLGGMGFTGGKVLDPSAGMGIFAQTKPDNVAVAQVELDEVSGKINGLLNNSDTVSTTVSPFEAVAASTEDGQYDAIVTNVPFGGTEMRDKHYKLDKKLQKADLTTYFILRTLDKLKFGGFAAFIVPSTIVSGKGGKSQKLRTSLSFIAEFIGAYRLPNQVFDEAGADVITDVIILRKHGREQTDKINELKQQNAGILTEAQVLWDEFLAGNYFKKSGKKYQIGESQMGMGKNGEVEKVVHTGDISSVAKLMRPFDKTGRINWELLNTTETMPITYKEGDTVYHNGALLQMTDGKLQIVDGGLDNENQEALSIKSNLDTYFNAIAKGVTYDDAKLVVDNETQNGRIDDLPIWVRQSVSFGGSDGGFKAIVAGLCVKELNDKNGTLDGTKYTELYPELTKVLAQVKRDAKKLSTNMTNEDVLHALQSIQKATNKQGYTAWWSGETVAIDDSIATPINTYDRYKQQMQDGEEYVSVETIKADVVSFDPFNDDDWAISPDGQGVIHVKDYYQGNYADFLERAKVDLDNAATHEIKEKLLKQHAKALERLPVVNISDMSFDLHSPYIGMDDKLTYLRQYVDSEFDITTNAKGEQVFSFNGKKSVNFNAAQEREHKLKSRFAEYLNRGTVTSRSNKTDGLSDDEKEAETELLKQIAMYVSQTNSGFDAWAKANPDVRNRLEKQLNDPSLLRFTEIPDCAPLDIDGWNPERKPEGHQNAAVRRFSNRFSGIMGFDVGLGKTLSALATVQYAHNIGTKKRTIFALPNSVLSNWKKEVELAYTNTDDCLYVGLRKNAKGKDKYDSSVVDDDLAAIVTGKYSKIFMTYETLSKIPMRDDTMSAYADYLLGNDDSIGEALIEQDEQKKGKTARESISERNAVEKAITSGRKSMAVPYFEDMGIDSIVIDEGHAFKNSKRFSTTGESGFASTKYVPNAPTSNRGLDIQAKCWYVRGASPAGDGVMALTATPITNSPLEIYSMLSLSIGEKEINAMTGCTGANSFMNAICAVEHEMYEGIDNNPKQGRVLKGIKNLPLVRRVLESACLIETAKSVADKGVVIVMPESTEEQVSVELPKNVAKTLQDMKDRFAELGKVKKAGGELSKSDAIYASPFNLIRNMSKLVIDPELYDGTFIFHFAKDDAEQAKKAVEAFNKQKNTEERKEHELPHDFDITGIKTKVTIDTDTGDDTVTYYVPIVATITGNKISMPAVTYDIQDKLVALLDKFKVEPIFVDSSPKISAMIANVKDENANPRWKPPKQIIFCDELGLHHKLRFMVAAETGISTSKIAIVNAKSVTPASLQDIQDGFNADGDAESDDENKYQIIIANKKAEVGINLQKGCQAIHHLTIGWTPDSTHQRNGRGVRQGNKIDTPIRVYHYDANGTFDTYKRHLVSVKADWIGSIMDKNAKTVDIQGDLSQEDYENMIAATGDSEAMARIQKDAAGKAKARVIQANRIAQANSIANMQAADKWLEKFNDNHNGCLEWAKAKYRSVVAMNTQASLLQGKLDKTESDMMSKRFTTQIAAIDAKVAEIEKQYEGIDPTKSYLRLDDVKETVGYKNWQAEVTLNQKMRDEARNSFTLRDNSGYSKATLEAIDKGDATVIGGKILSVGDIVETKDGIGVVWSAGGGYYGRKKDFFIGEQTEDGCNKGRTVLNTAVLRHAPIDTPDYDAMVKELAQLCDKAVSNGHKTDGAWEFSHAVLDAMVSVLPSIYIATDSKRYGFKSPLFPVYINDYFDGLEDEKAKQQAIIEGDARSFRFKDAKNMVEISDVGQSIKAWAIANNKRIKLNSNNAGYYYLIADGVITQARNQAVSTSKNANEYKENILKAMSEIEPALDFGVFDDLEDVIGRFHYKYIESDLIKLDDGSNPYYFNIDNEFGRIGFPDIFKSLIDDIENGNAPADIEYYSNRESSDAVDTFVQSVGGKLVDSGVQFNGEMAQKIREYLSVGLSAQPVMSMDYLRNRMSPNINQKLTGAIRAAQAKKALSDSHIDLDAVIEVVKTIGDVQNAYIGKEPYVSAKTPWMGSYSLDVGQYIRVSTVYGSKMSDKEDGLDGRSFDKTTKTWTFPLLPKEASDGKKLATVKDLLKYFGKDAEADKLFGA